VYPSENLDHMGVTCAVNLAGLEDKGKPASYYNTNIASPILAFSHEISNVETFIELALVGTPDHTMRFTGASGRNEANEQLQEC